jgi:hypothetical protein
MAGLECVTRLRANVSLTFALAGTAMPTPAQLVPAVSLPVAAWPTYARDNQQIWGMKLAFISVIKHHDRPPRRLLERSP